ncbi:ABC transporter permease [Kribbella lupini]|uniref:ABC transporter permease n=1 Tax=Kribbella lupini TaxID=291602 RepID=UPI0031D0A7BE
MTTTDPVMSQSTRSAAHQALVAAARSKSRSAARRSRLSNALTTVLVSVLLLVLWEILAELLLADRGVIASPSAILQSLGADAALYTNAVKVTAWEAARGWFFGNLAAIVVALVFVQIKTLESLFHRLALALFCLPLVAVNPLLQVTFEPDTAKVVLAAMSVFFFTLVGTLLGLRSADGAPMTMVKAWGGNSLDALRFVRLPSGVPSIITGLQIGAAGATLGAIFGEFIGARAGIGVLLINGLMTLNLSRVWTVAVLTTLMATIPYLFFGLVRKWLAPWSASISSAAPVKPASRRRSLPARSGLAFAWLTGSLVVIVLAWYAYLHVFQLTPFVGKSPIDVWSYLFSAPKAVEHRGVLLDGLRVTLVHSGVGYVAGLVIGVVTAVLFTLLTVVERVFTPLAVALGSVPIIALTPLLILAFGRGLWGVVAIAAIVTFFPTLTITRGGLKGVPRDAFVLMRSYDSSRLGTLWRVQLPYTLPSIFASARIAAPAAVFAATVAEWLATGNGLGHVIVNSRAHSDYSGVWAAAAVLTAVSLVFYSLVSWAERAALARYAPTHTS